jgi:hypothetical protein
LFEHPPRINIPASLLTTREDVRFPDIFTTKMHLRLNRKEEGTSRMKRLTLGLLLIAAAGAPPALLSAAGKTELKETEHRWLTKHPVILEMQLHINQERTRYNLAPVTIEPNMCLKAQEHAVWMAESGWFQHSNYPGMEIIYYGAKSAESAVNGWIWSPPHHGIMLSNASEAGFGYMVRNGRTYWVGVFR